MPSFEPRSATLEIAEQYLTIRLETQFSCRCMGDDNWLWLYSIVAEVRLGASRWQQRRRIMTCRILYSVLPSLRPPGVYTANVKRILMRHRRHHYRIAYRC